MKNRSKFLWMTDTHLMFYNRYKMLNTILDEKPHGVFLTGDISNCAFTLIQDLKFLGKRIGRPLYFVLGNHCLHGSDIKTVHSKVREVCQTYKNLIWMTDAGVVSLDEEVALIGENGWYDGRVGNTEFLKFTFDWFMIKDFRILPNMRARIEAFRSLADESAKVLSNLLEEALESHKTVYLLTHMPPWQEANRNNGWLSEAFWEPYNTNLALGQALEKVMDKHKKQNLIVCSGHVHRSSSVLVSHNIECRVGKGSYYKLSDDERIFI